MTNKLLKAICVGILCVAATSAMACPCRTKKCTCGDAQMFLANSSKDMVGQAEHLKSKANYMKEVATKNTEAKYKPLNDCLMNNGNFLLEQSDALIENGKVVMMYADETTGDMITIKPENRAKAKMDAQNLVMHGKHMRQAAQNHREKCMAQSARISSIQDPYVAKKMTEHQADMIEYIDVIVDNANNMISTGELIETQVQ